MKRIAILGGGISGLSAAFALQKSAACSAGEVQYQLFESSPRLGGVLLTEEVDGCQIEAGPDSFLTEKPWASDLCRELGLGDQLVGSNDVDRKTYIVVNDRLIEIPDGLMFMVPTKLMPTLLSPLFSVRTKLRMAAEWFHPPRKGTADETVASLVERHYGPEMVDRLADPLLSGVYGGEATQLSVRAVLPRFAEMEAQYGSLGRAMIAARQKMTQHSRGPAKPLFTSLIGGMQQMVDTLLQQLPKAVLRTSTPVQSLRRHDGAWLVSTPSAPEIFDAVILGVPANVASEILRTTSPELAEELEGVQYTSSVTVNLAYDGSVRSLLPPGFGFLVPRSEGKRMMAATFVHNKFPHRATPQRALLRCFIGGAKNQAILQSSEEELVGVVREELRQIIGLTATPLFTRIYRWNGAMAQYGVGHLERLQRIEQLLTTLPGLALAGNGYRGIGVPDCVRSGSEAAMKCLLALGIESGRVSATA